jgi:subtilase family serine protease
MRACQGFQATASSLCLLAVCLFSLPASGKSSQTLHNHVRTVVSSGRATRVGAMPHGQRMRLAIILPLRNQTDLTSLLKRLYDPSSPEYRHFLTVPQFVAQFGPTRQDYESVVKFARSKGFTVVNPPANRLVVHINGTVAQVNKAFHVTMTNYRHPTENRTFYSPDREPSLQLTVPVMHIAGLNNFSLPRPKYKRAPPNFRRAAIGSGPNGAYLGSDMRAAYYGGSTLTGSGESVGLLEFDGYNVSDVTASFAGQPSSVPIQNVLIDGATAGSDGDDAEQVLDIVQAASMAPGLSQIRVYIAPSHTQIGVGDVDVFNQMATDNIAKQLSCSWGWNPDDTAQLDPIFEEFAAQGQTLFVASGDAGAYTGSNTTDNSYPAEDVNVISVGGTDLTTHGAGGAWQSETAWSDSSGGPADDGFPIPSWQANVANSLNQASNRVRNVPDVAMEANTDNYACDQGTCSGDYGGTSFAAPRWAGFLALVNQQAVSGGNSALGFINPALYSLGQGPNYDQVLHDITSGNNNNSKGQSYNAVVGYDLVTGWGSPNGQNLINALAMPSTQAAP